MKNILIASDFSTHSDVALRVAARLAQAHGARLHSVHAIDWLTSWWSPMQVASDFTEKLKTEAQARLDQQLEPFATSGLEISGSAEIGAAWEVVLASAKQNDSDLIVIGTRGLGALPHALLGSTAERVLERAERPVLTVHSTDPPEPERIRKVIIPTDLALEIEEPLAAIQQLQANGELPELFLVHALHLPEFYWRAVGRSGEPDRRRYLEGMLETAREHLEEAASDLRTQGYKVTTEVHRGDPAACTIEVAEREGADLIALHNRGAARRHRFLLGKTARRLVQTAALPVLTIPAPEGDS